MNILIIDDHLLFTEGIKLVLEKLPLSEQISIVECHQPDMEQIEKTIHDHEIDLVLLDLNFPNVDGLSLLSMFISSQHLIPVIVVSAENDIHRIKQAFQLGALGFIAKSMNSQDMILAIMSVLEGKKYVPEDVLVAMKNAPEFVPFSKEDLNNKCNQHGISSRQFEILQRLASGKSNKGLAEDLYISEHTVKSHLKSLFQLLGAKSRTECLVKARQLGLIKGRD